jgi:hypothetical protein
MKTKSRDIRLESSPYPLRPEFLTTDVYYGMSFIRIGPGTVISRTNDGQPISLFEDNTWYLAAFAFHVHDNVHFNFLPLYQASSHSDENVAICKKIFIIKMFSINKKTGRPLRACTMQNVLLTLGYLCEFCASRSISIRDLLISLSTFKELQECLPTSLNRVLLSLIRTLNSLRGADISLQIDGSIYPYLQRKARETRTEGQQTPVIPSRILYAKYKQYHECIDDFIEHHGRLSVFLDKVASDPYFGRSSKSHYRIELKAESEPPLISLTGEADSFSNTARAYGLEKLLTKYDWRNVSSTSAFLTLVQHCCKNLIHLLTLMRQHEAFSLRTGCLEKVKGWNNEALYVAGITTKLYGKAKEMRWITTDAVLKPISTLEAINSILAPFAKRDSDLLFLPSSLLTSRIRNFTKSVHKGKSPDLRLPEVLITEADIRELESIDPFRNWRDDKKFHIGQPWKVSSHQFRRSIAVFAGQSGLITLPSLKRLLRHLTIVMSTYYMRGCSANNYYFNLANPELVKELKNAKMEADGAMYIREVLQSSERLFGTHGREIMEGRIKSAVWLDEPEEYTHEQVKLGLMAFAETPLGGCASVAPCDKRAHGDFTTCPGCKSLIGKESVMNETIAVMAFDLEQLTVGTMEHRAEKQNLDDFIALRDRILAKG